MAQAPRGSSGATRRPARCHRPARSLQSGPVSGEDHTAAVSVLYGQANAARRNDCHPDSLRPVRKACLSGAWGCRGGTDQGLSAISDSQVAAGQPTPPDGEAVTRARRSASGGSTRREEAVNQPGRARRTAGQSVTGTCINDREPEPRRPPPRR
ncbi:hypothetical protein SKAU_G00084540 [Synaphobranchus kaupii]|uniref:Uncharacterized protein n=1 Tax=Synaphobranchus kaupii TaxID=118154 RepID=A0A9Q1FVH0_SYNKA|nr:hypothetical protein SKAU_G00084540 [Synaphobranchus kaupii]